MAKAIGMIEYKTVASGMTAADLMVKTAEIDVIEAKTVCPGNISFWLRAISAPSRLP